MHLADALVLYTAYLLCSQLRLLARLTHRTLIFFILHSVDVALGGCALIVEEDTPKVAPCSIAVRSDEISLKALRCGSVVQSYVLVGAMLERGCFLDCTIRFEAY